MTRKTIDELRKEIDQINTKLLELISKRGEIAQEIGYLKQELGIPVYDPAREARILDSIAQKNKGPFTSETVKKLFKHIIRATAALQTRDAAVELLVSRTGRKENTVIQLDDVKIGHGRPVIIAGPCSVESEEQMDRIASHISKKGIRLLRGGAFKPRTSPYSFQGLRTRGLKILRKIADKYNMLVVTEVIDARHMEETSDTADVLQVGARNMYNYELLKELGKVKKPVLLKRGFMATLDELLNCAEYIYSRGNSQIILCERGIRTFQKLTRNTLDISAIPILKAESHLPVIVDVSHALGRTDVITPMAKAVLAAGADGLMVEVHDNPQMALSDSNQQMNLQQFDEMLREIEGLL